MSELVPHKPLDIEYVRKLRDDAKLALADLDTRREWARSKSGSPVVTMMLCAEIGRLQLERAEMLTTMREVQGVLAQLTKPNMKTGAGNIYFSAVAAETRARTVIAKAEPQ